METILPLHCRIFFVRDKDSYCISIGGFLKGMHRYCKIKDLAQNSREMLTTIIIPEGAILNMLQQCVLQVESNIYHTNFSWLALRVGSY